MPSSNRRQVHEAQQTKLDGVTRAIARLLEHLQATGHQALLLGPAPGMERYAGAEVIGTAGLPLPFYPELKVYMFRPRIEA